MKKTTRLKSKKSKTRRVKHKLHAFTLALKPLKTLAVFKNFKPARVAKLMDLPRSMAWFLPAFLLVFTLTVFVSKDRAGKHPVTFTSAKLLEYFSEAKAKGTLEARIAFWSDKIKQNPGLLAPLGKGPKINDSAPLFPSSFDCTTFVETVAGLARSTSTEDLAENIIDIRYRNGEVSYGNRNHFPEADWIPNNESAGILTDITAQVAYKSDIKVPYVEKVINKVAWFHQQKDKEATRVIAKTSEADEGTNVKLPYIPIEKAAEAVKNIPNGAVVNIVRASNDAQPVVITHQGFLVWKNGEAYLRHSTRHGFIKDVAFLDYLKRCCSDTWKVIGFNVNQFKG